MSLPNRVARLESRLEALRALLPSCPCCGELLPSDGSDRGGPASVIVLASPEGAAKLQRLQERVAELEKAVRERIEGIESELAECRAEAAAGEAP